MPARYDNGPSPRTVSFANGAALVDADGIKTLVATVATAASYTGAALNGAYANPGPAYPTPGTHTGLAQYPTVTTTSETPDTYNITDPIVFTGTYGGEVATSSATLVAVKGGEAIIGDHPLDSVVSIAVPAQLGTAGEFTFGFTDLAARKANGIIYPWRKVRAGGAGNVGLKFECQDVDTLAMLEGEKDDLLITRVVAATTNVAFRLYE
jgi:hypothetical protein